MLMGRRFTMRRAVWLLLAGCTGGAPPKDEGDDLIADFLAENGLEPTSCGAVVVDVVGGCSGEGEAGACMSAAWEACTTAQLEITRTTIEGDPIVETLIIWDDGGTCKIEQFYDNSQDSFGGEDVGVTESVCTEFVWTEDLEACDTFATSGCQPR
jgi:hypothetical protein